ncbi:MAG: hypothetical protein WD801_12180 [Gemmatimonadaceae bacterium]
MPISPHLLRKLQETLGADAADDLVTWMEAMDANRGDVGELRHEMQMGFARMDARFEQFLAVMEARFQQVDARFQQVDARFETVLAMMDARFNDVDGKFLLIQEQGARLLEKALREQTRFFFLAWSVLLAAFIGLYAR